MTPRRPHSRSIHADEALAIRARDVRFDWTGVPLEYIPHEPYATHFWNVMHMVLPEGEHAMADIFTQALDHIDEPRLREEVIGFVGQENKHAASHETFRRYLADHGVDVAPIMARIRFAVGRVFGDHGLTGRAREQWLFERIAIYAAAEHYTAVVGEWLLDNTTFDRIGVDPTMLDLLRWHGAEEMEHRSVTFDAYQYVDGGWFRRARAGVVAVLGLAVIWFWTAARLYRDDPTVTRRLPWPLAFVRAAHRGLVPRFSFLLVQLWIYLQPGYHPTDAGGIDKAVRYLGRSPATLAAQTAQTAQVASVAPVAQA